MEAVLNKVLKSGGFAMSIRPGMTPSTDFLEIENLAQNSRHAEELADAIRKYGGAVEAKSYGHGVQVYGSTTTIHKIYMKIKAHPLFQNSGPEKGAIWNR